MPSDILPVLRRTYSKARAVEADQRHHEAPSCWHAEALLEELTGHKIGGAFAREFGPARTAAICMAKAVRILASMLAAKYGETLPIKGILEDLKPFAPARKHPRIRREHSARRREMPDETRYSLPPPRPRPPRD